MKNRDREVSRRTFLKTAGLATGSALALPHFIPATVFGLQWSHGANQRLSVALIGVGERGTNHLVNMADRMGKGLVNVAAVCDVDEKRLEKALQIAGPKTDVYRDYRYILERKDIDAVIIATPDHWHGVQFVQAAQCGKHVYCESPACSTIDEGKAMIEAARKAKIATQIGAQAVRKAEAYLMHVTWPTRDDRQGDESTCWSNPGLTDDNPVPDNPNA